MRCLFGFFIFLTLVTSCTGALEFKTIGEKYYIDSHPKNPNIDVYHASENKRKLNGQIILKTTGLYDTTLHFTMTGNFKKGLLDGRCSIVRNNTLIRIENYKKGVKIGEQSELEDSIETISPYKNGVIHGFQRTYVNHRIQKSSYFNHGIKDSVEYFYDSLGRISTTFRYYFSSPEKWARMDFGDRQLVSFSGDTLSIQTLNRSEYRGRIVFNSHDPKGIGSAWAPDVVHESITFDDFEEEDPPIPNGYFYIIDENTCSVCDYIDFEGIWVAYNNGFDLEFYELRTY